MIGAISPTIDPNPPLLSWTDVQKLLRDMGTKMRQPMIVWLKSWQARLIKERDEIDKKLAIVRKLEEESKKAKTVTGPKIASVQAVQFNNAEELFIAMSVTDAEKAKLGTLVNAISQDDLTKLQRKVLGIRTAQTRRNMFTDAFKKTFTVDEKKWDEITSENEKSWGNFIFNKQKLKLQSHRTATNGPGYLAKGAIQAATYNQVNIQVVVNENGQKKKKNVAITMGQALELLYRQTIGRITEFVKTTVDVTVKAVETRIAVSPLGKAMANVKTTAGKIGNVLAVGTDVLKTTGMVINSATQAAIPAALMFLATGGSVPIALTTLGVMTVGNTAQKILAEPKLSRIAPIRNLQIKYGVAELKNGNYWRTDLERAKIEPKIAELRTKQAQFNKAPSQIVELQKETSILEGRVTSLYSSESYFQGDVDTIEARLQAIGRRIEELKATPEFGSEDLAKLNKLEHELELTSKLEKTSNVFSREFRGIRAGNAGMLWGTLGFSLAALFGVNPIVGGLLGIAAGAGGRLLADSVIGKATYNFMTGKLPFLKVLGEMPLTEIVGAIQTNIWIGTQLQMILEHYHGDLGLYFKENFLFNDKSHPIWENVLVSGSNWIQVGLAIPAEIGLGTGVLGFSSAIIDAMIPGGAAEAVAEGAAITTEGAVITTETTVGGPVVGLSIAVGTLASLGLLTALSSVLGITVGGGALIGATIGGIAGATAATILVLVFPPSAILVPFVIGGASFITGFLGGWIGGKIDKAIGASIGQLMAMVNAVSALFQLMHMLTEEFKIGNIVYIALSMIMFIQTIDKMSLSANDNQSLTPRTETTSQITPSLEKLSFYDVNLVNNGPLPNVARTSLIEYLNNNSAQLHKQYPGKQIFITTAENGSYESESFVLLGVSQDILISGDQNVIANALQNTSSNLAQVPADLPNLQTLGN